MELGAIQVQVGEEYTHPVGRPPLRDLDDGVGSPTAVLRAARREEGHDTALALSGQLTRRKRVGELVLTWIEDRRPAHEVPPGDDGGLCAVAGRRSHPCNTTN